MRVPADPTESGWKRWKAVKNNGKRSDKRRNNDPLVFAYSRKEQKLENSIVRQPFLLQLESWPFDASSEVMEQQQTGMVSQ